MTDIRTFFRLRTVLFFGVLAGWLFWLTTLAYPLDILAGGVGVVLAAVALIKLRAVAGADFVAIGGLAAVYAVVEGVLR